MFSVDEYVRSIKANLEKESDSVVANMKKISTYNFSSDIDLLDFTPSIEPTRFEISITMFSMDKDANEVFNEGNDQTVFAGSEEVLLEVEYHQLDGDQLEEFFDFYEQNEETLVSQEQQAFADWFRQCWETGGGASLDLPSYFTFHDEGKSYDLKNKKWIDDEEKWL